MSEKIPFYLLKERDRQKMAEQLAQHPELGSSAHPTNFVPGILQRIGIDYAAPIISEGYLKLHSQDFIVEEITSDLTIQSIAPGNPSIPPYDKEDGQTKLQATLVKAGMDTFESLERLAEQLECEVNQITYAGLKDAKAITAQRVTFNKVDTDRLANLAIPHLHLKDFAWRKGVETTGNLYGNRFTIFVRTPHAITPESLQHSLQKIEAHGFPNYYSLQRFGPRLNTHTIGKHILMGQYQRAIAELLIGISPHEIQLFQQLRRNVANHWGDWRAMRLIYEEYPIFLRYEVEVLRSLEQTSGNWLKAIQAIKDEARLCVYAYFSFYFNKLLSLHLSTGQEIPDTLPLLRPEPEYATLYRSLIPQDELQRLRFHLPELPFIRLQKVQQVTTMSKPKIWSAIPTEGGVVFHFDLQKGSYATSLLSHLFHLYQTKPYPAWLSHAPLDSRPLLGYPALSDSLEALQWEAAVSGE
jgi:tRNA(Glu) U13 pseudouridine synthase TruD